MPGAQTHDLITFASGAVIAPLSFIALSSQVPPGQAVNAALLLGLAHVVSGTMFSPDLDIDSAIDDRWGIFYWIWRPYMWFVPHRHRILSHGPVFSALLRLFYFYIVVLLMVTALNLVLMQLGIEIRYNYVSVTDWLWNLAGRYPLEVGAVLVGFVTGGDVHILADWLVTGGRGFLNRFGIRLNRSYFFHDRVRRRTRRRALWGA